MATDGYEWDAAKAAANLRKHGVDFADAATSLDDPFCLTTTDPDSNGEQRLVSIGMSLTGRVLVTIFAYRGDSVRLISSRPATTNERRRYQER
jgi:uncharacterized DUF497 family protein